MNPTTLLGSLASLLGIGGSLANQAVALHRDMNPPQQQQAAAQSNQQCPAGTRLVVLIKPDGTRQLYCMQEQEGQR
jgi:hypothetical protein